MKIDSSDASGHCHKYIFRTGEARQEREKRSPSSVTAPLKEDHITQQKTVPEDDYRISASQSRHSGEVRKVVPATISDLSLTMRQQKMSFGDEEMSLEIGSGGFRL